LLLRERCQRGRFNWEITLKLFGTNSCWIRKTLFSWLIFHFLLLGEVTRTKDGRSKNLTRTRNVPPKCNKQVTTKQQTDSLSLLSTNLVRQR
jgi:hypothetical protein